jgi:gas vesicle protein GvpN
MVEKDSVKLQTKFIETPFLSNLLNKVMLYLNSDYPIHLSGPAGIGKTTIAFQIAKLLNQPFVLMFGSDKLSTLDLVGGYIGYKQKVILDKYIRSVEKREEHFEQDWVDGRILTACKFGYTLIYDEFTRTKPEINNILLPILEEKVIETTEYETEKFIKVHPNFKAIFTSNPVEYAGVYKSQDALLDRMITVNLFDLDIETEITITATKTGLEINEVTKIVKIINALRAYLKGKINPTIRGSIMIAEIVKKNNISVDIANQTFLEIIKDVINMKDSECISNEYFQEIISEALLFEKKKGALIANKITRYYHQN